MDEPQSRPFTRVDLGLVALLMLLALGMRLWQLAHTEVAARDSIGFIRIAWEIDHLGWSRAIANPTAEQHPGYPLTILAVHRLAGSWLGDNEPVAWQLAAQIASSLASVLLVLPVYLLGLRLFDRAAAVAGVVLLQCFPAVGRLLGDGLSEALFLLLAASAFWAVYRAFDTGRPAWFLAAGLFSGLGYFVRPEGLIVGLCAGVVLTAMQCFRASRERWSVWGGRAGSLAAGALLCVGLFVATTGELTTKATAGRMGQDVLNWLYQLFGGSAQAAEPVRSQGPLLAAWWGQGPESAADQRLGWAGKQLVLMLLRGTFYVGTFFGLIGMWQHRRRLAEPGGVTTLLVIGVLALLLFRVAWKLGYLSDRHLALILLAFTPYVAAGLVAVGRAVPAWSGWLPAVLVVLLAAPAGYRTLLPLHGEREGFREAGLWLGTVVRPGEEVLDPFAWTAYYAGREFRPPAKDPPVVYVLRERGDSEHLRHQGTIAKFDALIAEHRGRVVRTWKLRRGELEVVEVRLPRPPASLPAAG